MGISIGQWDVMGVDSRPTPIGSAAQEIVAGSQAVEGIAPTLVLLDHPNARAGGTTGLKNPCPVEVALADWRIDGPCWEPIVANDLQILAMKQRLTAGQTLDQVLGIYASESCPIHIYLNCQAGLIDKDV